MGRIGAVFKADGAETRTATPSRSGARAPHVGERWTQASKGSFVLVPGGTVHDFENRTDERAGMLNVSVPGSFEKEMPGISAWFAEHPPKNV